VLAHPGNRPPGDWSRRADVKHRVGAIAMVVLLLHIPGNEPSGHRRLQRCQPDEYGG
jgi:hypothetical protein